MRRSTLTSRVARLAVLMASIVPMIIGAQPARAEDGAVKEGAIVSGVVRFDGPKPVRKQIAMVEKYGKVSECNMSHPNGLLSEEALVSDKGELANVFVYVKKGLAKKAKYPMPEKPAVLSQDKCMFRPRVLGVRIGQKLHIKNGDQVLHNVRGFFRRNRPFNIAQPPASKIREKTFRRPESAVRIKCDIHPWMIGYVFAIEHPYFAVSAKSGKFKIKGLPAGDYTLAAWHEVYGEQKADITVGKSGTVESNFTFKPAEPKK